MPLHNPMPSHGLGQGVGIGVDVLNSKCVMRAIDSRNRMARDWLSHHWILIRPRRRQAILRCPQIPVPFQMARFWRRRLNRLAVVAAQLPLAPERFQVDFALRRGFPRVGPPVVDSLLE